MSRYLTHIMTIGWYRLKHFIHHIMMLERKEQVYVIGSLFLLVLAIVSPLMVLSPNEDSSSGWYIFLLTISLFKTMCVVVWALLTNVVRHLNINFRNYIIDSIGFQKNTYLFSLFLLFIPLASLMGLGEMNSLLTDYTMMLRMHTMYYVIQILLVAQIGYTIYLMLENAQGWYKGTIVWYHPQSTTKSDDDMQWLFDNIKDQE